MSDQWVFGSFFLYKYGVNYDYESSTITFYSNEPFVYQEPTKPINMIKSIYVIISCIDSIVFIYKIIIKYKENKQI